MKKFTLARLNLVQQPPVRRAMNSLNGLKVTLLAILALALLPALAAATPKFDKEFSVPGIETPDQIVEGQDGNMWVTVSGAKAGDNGNDDVARITPAGEVKEFELKAGQTALEGASGIARDAEGHLWVTGAGRVAKFTPRAGEVSETVVEDLAQVQGVGQGGASIILGPDARMWIATLQTAIAFKPTETDLENHDQQIPIGGLNPHDIDVAGQLLAIADQTKIVTLKTDGSLAKEYPLDGFSQGVAGTKAGSFAYSEPGAGNGQRVGVISPPDAQPTIETPKGLGDPFGVAVGSDGAYWFVLGGAGFGELGRLAPGRTTLELFPGMPKDGLERQIAAGPNNTLWVTVSKAESEAVALYTGLEPPKKEEEEKETAEPQTTIAKGPGATVRTRGARATVSFAISSSPAGASFQCRLVQIGAKASGFGACGARKTYRLRPGRYRFAARAVLGGKADETPATAAFRVVHIGPHRHR